MKFSEGFKDMGNSGGGNFLKLGDGESVVGIFRGDVYEFYQLWDDTAEGGRKSQVVPEGTAGAKARFRINFIVKDKDGYHPMIFENGPRVHAQLAELHEEFGLETTVVKLTRNGLKLETKYSIMPIKNNQVSDETLELLRDLELHKLEHSDDR